MTVIESIRSSSSPIFSFEILPPLKGNDIQTVYNVVDKLREFDPKYINITAHHNEGSRRRPGTVAIAAALQFRYGIAAVPHIICMGFTREETESALIDLNYLGIHNLLLLRGDSKGLPMPDASTSNIYALELQAQVNDFNRGIGLDGVELRGIDTPFAYGMACYPETHAEAVSAESDLDIAGCKVAAGAQYLVTQMFFDNRKYFDFVDRCRAIGIDVPIIPGIKPIVKMDQLQIIPKVFSCEMPEPLTSALAGAKTDSEAVEIGVEWSIAQCHDLIAHGVPGIHFYTFLASDSVQRIAKAVF